MTWFTRRRFLQTCLATALVTRNGHAAPGSVSHDDIAASLAVLERQSGGRLGVFMLDTGTQRQFGYRADERFLTLSSFKWLACAHVLHRVDHGLESLERRIAFGQSALLPWSPVTREQADGAGMRIADLCAAAITTSDNTAANLILESYGGPAALTAYLRQLGDTVTRLDRYELALNVRDPELPLDTTTPRSMAFLLNTLVLGKALSETSRQQLRDWLLRNTTGQTRLRAGLPRDWPVGEKTGTYQNDANDSGIVWPPGRPPWIISAYLADSPTDSQTRDHIIAEVARLATTALN